MGDTWIVDMRHYLDDGGRLPDLPTPALNIALHLGSIVAWVTARKITGVQRTNVHCRRSPGRKRCTAEIEAMFERPGGTILWRCPICGDNGYISGWKGSPWDRSKAAPGDAGGQLSLIVGGLGEKRRRIAEEEEVPVTLSLRDRKLLDDLALDPEYLERLRPVPGSEDLAAKYTLDDLEDMLGCIAAEANHTSSARRRKELDNLYDRLAQIQRSYDDGNWNDSDV